MIYIFGSKPDWIMDFSLANNAKGTNIIYQNNPIYVCSVVLNATN